MKLIIVGKVYGVIILVIVMGSIFTNVIVQRVING